MTTNQANPAPTQRVRYYRAAIGNRNTDYYLGKFNRFGAKGVGLSWSWSHAASWNWAAFIFGLPWLVYRKMWSWALLYFAPMLIIAASASLAPTTIIKFFPIYLIYLLLVFVLFPIYANALYYRKLRRKIQEILWQAGNPNQRLELIATECGTNTLAAPAALLVLLTPLLVVVENAVMAGIDSYHHRVVIEKIDQRLLLGEGYKVGMAVYFRKHGKWPESTADLKDSIPSDPHSEQITTDGSGKLIIHFTDIDWDGSGGSISFQPTVVEENRVLWSCSGQDMKETLLPVRCRSK